MAETKQKYVKRLTAGQQRALELMADGRPDSEIARVVKVSVTTVWRWRKHPVFAEKLRYIQSSAMAELIERIRASAATGLEVLVSLATDSEVAATVRADVSKSLVNFAMSSKSLEADSVILEQMKEAASVVAQ